MDSLDYIHSEINEQAIRCDVLRPTDSTDADSAVNVYDTDLTETGETVQVAIFQPSATSTVETEGTGQDTSLTAHLVPHRNQHGDLVERVQVGDRLRVSHNTAKQYEVRTKNGVPNELAPEIWQLGLEPANSQ